MLRATSRLLVLLILAAPAAATAGVIDAAVGADGELYQVVAGTYGELFPDGSSVDPSYSVLAVDVDQPGEEPQRLLVPDTEGEEAEGTPTVVFEDSQNALFLVWESKLLPTVSRINLVWLSGGAFSEVVEASGDVRPLKGSPQLVITRDHVELQPDVDTVIKIDRTFLHVAWWEEAADSEDVYYTPIVLEGGAYVGQNPVISLTTLDPNPVPDEPLGTPENLRHAPVLAPGRNARAVVLGFANPRTERFLGFEIQVVPGEVSHLSDGVVRFVEEQGDLYNETDLPTLADRLGMHIVDLGARFNPPVVDMLADGSVDEVLSIGAGDPGGVNALADRLGMHIVDLAGGMYADGGLATLLPPTVSEFVTVMPVEDAGTLAHHLWLRVWGDRPIPSIGEGAVRIAVSEDARRTLITWEESDALAFRETDGSDGWSEVRRVRLGDTLDADYAYEIVRRRVRER